MAGCRVMLRIEDHDRERCRPEYERGHPRRSRLARLRAGRVPDAHVPGGAVRWTSERPRGRLSRRAAPAARPASWSTPATAPAVRWRRRGARPDPGGEPRYPGTCRDRGLPLADGVGWRVRLPAGVEAFDDALLGRQEQSPAEQCGDMLIRDRLGNWTYQFAVTVDDWRQGVDLVIRGVDLLPSTGRQIQLAPSARPRGPADLHASSAGHEDPRSEVEQVGSRDRHPGFAGRGLDAGAGSRGGRAGLHERADGRALPSRAAATQGYGGPPSCAERRSTRRLEPHGRRTARGFRPRTWRID